MDPITASLITAGSQIAGQGINAMTQASMNAKTRKWNEKMYQRQRQDSLADWTMQNEYNSPMAQMKRLREAGLNPHLVYGKGADNVSAPVRSTDAKGWNPQAPEVDLGSVARTGLFSYYDAQVKQAQIDNLKAQNDNITQDSLLKAAQILNVGQNTKKSEFDLSLAKELKQYSVDAAAAAVRQMEANTKSILDANERAAAMQAPTLLKAAEEILTLRMNRSKTEIEKQQIRQQIENLKTDNRLKQLDINLKNMGIQPSDNLALRMLGQMLPQNLGETIKGGFKDAWKWTKDLFK